MINLYKIKDIGKFFGGLTGKSKEDFDTGNAKFVSYMTVFSNPQLPGVINDTVLISENEKQNKITKGDILFTGSSETPDECGMSCVVTQEIDEDIYLNSFCFGLRLNNKEIANPAYLSHYFRSNYARKQIKKSANGVTRFNISKKKFSEVEIVIPPIKVQEEIVKILDSFTNLIDALNEELSLRQKQFEYYREKLLTFDDNTNMQKICNFATIQSGKNKERTDNGQFPLFGSTGLISRTNISVYEGDYILIARVGANAGFTYRVNGKFDVSDNTLIVTIIKNNTINIDYLYHCLIEQNLNKYAKGGGQPLVTSGELKNISIPIPSLAIQQSIVEKLDAFESLFSSLKEEIALRQKQYEYYREKLLTFN